MNRIHLETNLTSIVALRLRVQYTADSRDNFQAANAPE